MNTRITVGVLIGLITGVVSGILTSPKLGRESRLALKQMKQRAVAGFPKTKK